MPMMFPSSHFTQAKLEEYAGRFVIPDRYFNPEYAPITRSAAVLNHDELRYVQQELTNAQLELVMEMYYKLTTFDTTFLIPRVPINVAMGLLEMNKSLTSSMKRLCNTMRDMDVEEYNRRVTMKMKDDMSRAFADNTFTFNHPTPKQDMTVYAEKIGKIKRYLNAKNCLKIPKELGYIIREVPKYMVKRVWSGPRFETMYLKMLGKYREK